MSDTKFTFFEFHFNDIGDLGFGNSTPASESPAPSSPATSDTTGSLGKAILIGFMILLAAFLAWWWTRKSASDVDVTEFDP